MRIYQSDSLDRNPAPYTFVEVESDGFLEINMPKMESLNEATKQRLRAFVRKIRTEEKRSKRYHIRLAKRFFTTLHPVPNLRLVGEF